MLNASIYDGSKVYQAPSIFGDNMGDLYIDGIMGGFVNGKPHKKIYPYFSSFIKYEQYIKFPVVGTIGKEYRIAFDKSGHEILIKNELDKTIKE
jgi:hypothetical protein